MLQLISLSHVFRNFQYGRMYMILGLIVVFTGLFCLCKDEEFAGTIHLHHHIQDIKHMISGNKHSPSRDRHASNGVLPSFSHNFSDGLLAHIFNRFYYVVVCTTMLGFGDIYPITLKTRCLTILYILVIFFAAFF